MNVSVEVKHLAGPWCLTSAPPPGRHSAPLCIAVLLRWAGGVLPMCLRCGFLLSVGLLQTPLASEGGRPITKMPLCMYECMYVCVCVNVCV